MVASCILTLARDNSSYVAVRSAADRICGKRLKAALPHLVESMEHHGHLDLDPEVRARLLIASAATLARLLKLIRSRVASRRKRRRNLQRGRHIPVRTFANWNRPPPVFLEIDLVAHCGESMGGSFVYSLVATDVCTGWTEAVPLLAREQSLVVTGLEAIAKQLPFLVLGIDSDNDSVFINDTLTEYCADRGIEFTRSRAYRKNDQAWVEQKNGAVIRRFLGHERYSGQVAGQTIAHLHGVMRLYVNYFQPSFNLLDKTRNGSVVTKRSGGVKSQSKSKENRGRERRTLSELGRILSKACGATCWAGCRKIWTPARWHCWAG